MLKAMGVELWWAKAPKAAEPAALAAAVLERPASPAQPVVPRSPVQLAEPAVPGRPAALEQGSPAPAPMAQPAALAPLPAAAVNPPLERMEAVAVATQDAVLSWTVPIRWQSQQESGESVQHASADSAAARASSASPSLLLLIDDLQGLGDVQPAATQLLENMVRAMGLAQSPALWLSWARRATPQSQAQAQAQAQSSAEQAMPAASAEALLAQTGAQVVLTMGREAAQHWLGRTEPLGALRQDGHRMHGLPVVVTYSPVYLLRATHAKRQAWADLQRAMALLAAAGMA